MTRNERTGWRDLALNDRHRTWGLNCPAADNDFVLEVFVEYDRHEPVALVEYGREGGPPKGGPNDASCDAWRRVADRADLPFFGVRYSADFSRWVVSPRNDAALRWLTVRTVYNEADYVRFLYRIRGRSADDYLHEPDLARVLG